MFHKNVINPHLIRITLNIGIPLIIKDLLNLPFIEGLFLFNRDYRNSCNVHL